MKKQRSATKLALARETLRTLDPEQTREARGLSGATCFTCTSLTSANSACHAQDTTPLCE